MTDKQIGCHTKAINLAIFILDLISKNKIQFGIYHFTDGEAMTWYDFAKVILIENGLVDKVSLVRDRKYRTFVKTPKNRVLKYNPK